MTGHLLVVREAGRIRAGLPIYEVKSRLTGRRLVSIPFATLCDPLSSNMDDTWRLLEAARDLSGRTGSLYVEVRTTRPLPPAAAPGFAVSDRFRHHYLRLEDRLETLRKRCDRSCVRQRIDRAMRCGVEVVTVVDEPALRDFYALYVKTRKRLALAPQPYRFIRSLWTTFAPAGHVEVQLALYGGQPVAGILLLRFNRRVSAEYLVSDDAHRDVSPNQLLVWNAIRQAHTQGFRVFDFGRTDVSHVTLMDFKRRWGTEVTGLPVYYHPKAYAEGIHVHRLGLRRAAGWASRLLPESGNRWLGNLVYRHMG